MPWCAFSIDCPLTGFSLLGPQNRCPRPLVGGCQYRVFLKKWPGPQTGARLRKWGFDCNSVQSLLSFSNLNFVHAIFDHDSSSSVDVDWLSLWPTDKIIPYKAQPQLDQNLQIPWVNGCTV